MGFTLVRRSLTISLVSRSRWFCGLPQNHLGYPCHYRAQRFYFDDNHYSNPASGALK